MASSECAGTASACSVSLAQTMLASTSKKTATPALLMLADGTVFPVRLRPAIPPRAVGACWLCAMELSGAAKEFLHLLEGGAPSVPQAQKG